MDILAILIRMECTSRESLEGKCENNFKFHKLNLCQRCHHRFMKKKESGAEMRKRMQDRVQKALENHKKGYNCCQAVACAYADLAGMDEATMFRVAEGFGAGMGGMQGVCGAVSAVVILAGLKNSSGDVTNPTTKGRTYKDSKEILEQFEQLNQSVICKELKGVDTNQVLRSCPGCVEDAAKLAEELFAEESNQ